tara:strand:- start:8970 stop:9107 length:138 start_codon:yes stop_codon:yes gene_type:complete
MTDEEKKKAEEFAKETARETWDSWITDSSIIEYQSEHENCEDCGK